MVLFLFWIQVLVLPQSKDGRLGTKWLTRPYLNVPDIPSFDSSPLSCQKWEDSVQFGLGCFPLCFSQRCFLGEPLPKNGVSPVVLRHSSFPHVPKEAEI